MKSSYLKYISLKCVITFMICFVVYMSCTDPSSTKALPEVIDIAQVRTHFPEIEGYEEFKVHCITCHSLRYIEMQPDFPEKTWDHIVHKMVKNFGAPIPDSSIAVIVKYLVEVKSREEG